MTAEANAKAPPGLTQAQDAMRAALHDDSPDALLALIAQGGAGAHGPRERIEVYRTMYWARQAEALADDFPSVQRMLGEALFDRVAVTHVKRHPSGSPSLAFLGRELTETLQHLGLAVEAEVAKLEWARVDAFWAPHAEPATPALLGSLGEGLGDAVLDMHPSLRRLELPASIRPFVSGNGPRPTEASVTPEATEVVVVWRRGGAVVDAVIDASEARALALALRGEPVAVVCEAFLEDEAPEDAAIQALVRWVTSGWVAGVR